MLLTPISTGKDAGPRLGETSVAVGMNIFHTFINQIQVDLMAGIKGGLCEPVNRLSTGV